MKTKEPSLKEKVNWLINGYLTIGFEGNANLEYIADHDMQDFRNDMVELVESVATTNLVVEDWKEFDKVYAPIYLEVNEGVGEDFKKRIKSFITKALVKAKEQQLIKLLADMESMATAKECIHATKLILLQKK